MRLGGSIPLPGLTPHTWGEAAARLGYGAATWPAPIGASREAERDYLKEARERDIVIAEVGVWRNTLSPDDAERARSMAYAKECLATAERIGARCCVNIAGARGALWDGGYADNYTQDTYALIVDSVREIIDAVKPIRTFYTLEPMPWMLPDSADSYLQLIRDIDRPAFAVHLDFANMLNTPARFLRSTAFVMDCVERLAPYIRSVHYKDVRMDAHLMPCQILECPPGQGMLEHRAILRCLHRVLPADTPVLLEHMDTMEGYEAAFRCLAGEAEAIGVPIRGANA